MADVARRQQANRDAHFLNLVAVGCGASQGKAGFEAYQRLITELNRQAQDYGNHRPQHR